MGGESKHAQTTSTSTVELNEEEEEYLLNKSSINARLLFAVFVCGFFSSFQIGYNTGVVNAPASFIQRWINESHEHTFGHSMKESTVTIVFSAAVSVFAIGGMVGGLLVGWAADKFGRVKSLHFNNVLSLTAGVFMCSAVQANINFYPLFHLGRFLIGVNAGFASGLVPLLLTELSPIKYRGAFGSISQLVVTIAILIAQILGLKWVFGTSNNWPWMFAVIVIPSALQVIALFFVPESPKFTLLFRENYDLALSDLMKFRLNEEYARLELKAFEHEKSKNSFGQSLSIKQLFGTRAMWWPLLLGCALMAFQQLSGINAVMFYSTKIFQQAKLGENAIYATIAMALVNVLVSLLSVKMVDMCGRRILLYIGKLGMSVSSLGLVVSMALTEHKIIDNVMPYFSILFVLAFVFFFACGPGAIPFFYMNEIFSNRARGSAQSIGVSANWTFNFIVGLSFLPLNDLLGVYTFLIFAVICLLAFAFILVYVPETKGKQIDEVGEEMNSRKPRCFN